MPGPISNQVAFPARVVSGARQTGALALDPVEDFFERAGGRRFSLSRGQIGKHAFPVFDLRPQRLVRFQALREGMSILLAEQPKGILNRIVGPRRHWLRHRCNFSTAR